MTLAIASRRTPVLPRATSSVPPVFERAFGGEGVGLPGYTEPYVIMEKLATDFPEPLTSLFYTSAYAERNNVQLTSEQVFQFPDGITIDDVVSGFQRILKATSVKFETTPEDVTRGTEIVTVKYKPQYDVNSQDYKNVFLPLLYGALGLTVHQFRGRQIQKT